MSETKAEFSKVSFSIFFFFALLKFSYIFSSTVQCTCVFTLARSGGWDAQFSGMRRDLELQNESCQGNVSRVTPCLVILLLLLLSTELFHVLESSLMRMMQDRDVDVMCVRVIYPSV